MKGCREFQIMVGKSIRELRKSQGMSQEEFSELTGVSTYSIKTVEKGGCNWRIGTIFRIAEGLGMNARDIFLLSQLEHQKRELFLEMENLIEEIKVMMKDQVEEIRG